ncbi:PTS system, galactitol-specific IIA component [Liquorilactobacillus sucicola DSM 21376 = JCM 15457]|uniref:Galactitol PTS, EIIA n=2 Tax=Liquorilactobacillus sucicola TaxID=519050 RepID=A0A023CWW7_9LACO|nr:PTS sugar transporter subunit IIA [Liquorilactobacillus sucicola]AJA34339.1 PTS system galactitol-specific IIA component [Liquorilactobacillus sucicola]KRN06879.1 galactitol PTS, EIIA [Liquorilactobacillus sucicola DSM 21376 = JCM 15457]GAJ26357.1 PTS system, galactitol-specific IIA component [Liquorilactobacillus sucicola DSM 21376 = JCM 15457]
MSEFDKLFDENLIFVDVEAADRQNLFEKVAKLLFDQGYVKASYLKALNKREDEFPTGILTENLAIALPHANPENVNKPFIAIVKCKNLIHVEQMGIGEDEETKNFFFLGIVKETQDLQVKLLQRFMQLMNDESFVNEYKKLNSSTDIYEYFLKKF